MPPCVKSAGRRYTPRDILPAGRQLRRARSQTTNNKKDSMMKIFRLFVACTLLCFALVRGTQAVVPAPDGCYPNFTTAEGCQALNSLTNGAGNTGVGWRSLFLNSTASFNTAIGTGALLLNNADSNTAVGAAALLL